MKVSEHSIDQGQTKIFSREDGYISLYIVEGQCSQLKYAAPVNIETEVTVTADQGPIVVRTIHE